MRKFSLLVLIVGALFLQACTVWSEHPVKKWTDVTGGESLERNFWQEVKSKNWAELDRHLAGNFVSASPQGTKDRAASIERLKALEIQEYSLGNFSVELHGNTLVVNYDFTAKGNWEGRPLSSTPLHMMSVWQQQKSGWMAIAHSTIGSQ
jgi:hypothetical protein